MPKVKISISVDKAVRQDLELLAQDKFQDHRKLSMYVNNLCKEHTEKLSAKLAGLRKKMVSKKKNGKDVI